MEMSESIAKLAEALSLVQGEVRPVVFDSSNPFFKSKYASLSALVSQAAPVLSKHGLAVTQILEDGHAVITVLMHKSGEWISSKLIIKPVKDDPQGVGSAITYSRRYSYAAILGLVSDEDDDGNAASKKSDRAVEVSTPKPVENGSSLQSIIDRKAKTIFKSRKKFDEFLSSLNLGAFESLKDFELAKVKMKLDELENVADEFGGEIVSNE